MSKNLRCRLYVFKNLETVKHKDGWEKDLGRFLSIAESEYKFQSITDLTDFLDDYSDVGTNVGTYATWRKYYLQCENEKDEFAAGLVSCIRTARFKKGKTYFKIDNCPHYFLISEEEARRYDKTNVETDAVEEPTANAQNAQQEDEPVMSASANKTNANVSSNIVQGDAVVQHLLHQIILNPDTELSAKEEFVLSICNPGAYNEYCKMKKANFRHKKKIAIMDSKDVVHVVPSYRNQINNTNIILGNAEKVMLDKLLDNLVLFVGRASDVSDITNKTEKLNLIDEDENFYVQTSDKVGMDINCLPHTWNRFINDMKNRGLLNLKKSNIQDVNCEEFAY